MNKTALQSCLTEAFDQTKKIALAANSEVFFKRPSPEQWSAAENLQHLSQSAEALNGLLAKGKGFIAEKWGNPSWSSRSYDDILTMYKQGLANGIKAFGPFLPVIETGSDMAGLLQNFDAVNAKTLTFLTQEWSDEDLDSHVIPHPALKALTAREMFYFTALHTRHHAELMLQRMAAQTS